MENISLPPKESKKDSITFAAIILTISWILGAPYVLFISIMGAAVQNASFIEKLLPLSLFLFSFVSMFSLSFLSIKKQSWKIAILVLPTVALIFWVHVIVYDSIESYVRGKNISARQQLPNPIGETWCPPDAYFNVEETRIQGSKVCTQISYPQVIKKVPENGVCKIEEEKDKLLCPSGTVLSGWSGPDNCEIICRGSSQ